MDIAEANKMLRNLNDRGALWGTASESEPWHCVVEPFTDPLQFLCGDPVTMWRYGTWKGVEHGGPLPAGRICEKCVQSSQVRLARG